MDSMMGTGLGEPRVPLRISDRDGDLGTITYSNGQLTGSNEGMQRLADQVTASTGSPEAAYAELAALDNGYMRAVAAA